MARQERQKRGEEYRKISRKADELIRSGQKDEAIELVQEWVGRCREVGDEDYALFFEAEVASYSLGDYDEAIRLMEEAFVWRKKEGLGGDSLLLRSQGVYYSWQGKEDQAINWFDKALEANPKDSDAMRQKGVSLSKKRDEDGAIEWYDKALEGNPKDYDAMRQKGVSLSEKGDYDGAIEWFDKALEVNPKNYDAMREKGLSLSKKGDEDGAIEWFDKALEGNPKDHHAMRNKGASLSKKGYVDGAIEWFDKTLEENPKDYDAMRNKGILFSKKGHHGGAIEWCNKALEVNPKDYDAIREMGTSLSNMGDEDGAIEWFVKALVVNPEDALAYRNKSVSEFNRGNKEESFKLLCKAIQLRPEGFRDEFIFLCNALGKDVKKEWEKLFPGGKQLEGAVAVPKEPEASSEVHELKGFIGRFREMYKKQADEFLEMQDEEERKRKIFLQPNSLFQGEPTSLLLTLRRWNSFTPAMPTGDKERSIGGGYFLKHGDTGIVIDPGYHFVENFYQAGGRMCDVDVVIMTHAHNDHTIEFETLLTLVHEYNENLAELQKDGKFKKSKEKKIDVYMNNGAFLKFSGLLDLRNRGVVRHVYTLNKGNTYEVGEGVNLEVVEAYHDELVAKEQSVGLIFKLKTSEDERKVIFTSDTGLLPQDPRSQKPVALKDYKREVWRSYMRDGKRPDVLVVHIGAIKKEELDGKFVEPEDACYPNHLGIIGTARVITQCKPKLAIVSEFGEEMKKFRYDLISGLQTDVVEAFLKSSGQDVSDLRVVPGDLALRYDLMGERFFSCVSTKWNGYKKIDFLEGSEDKDKQSGIYYFTKTQRSKFELDRGHFVRKFDGCFLNIQKMS